MLLGSAALALLLAGPAGASKPVHYDMVIGVDATSSGCKAPSKGHLDLDLNYFPEGNTLEQNQALAKRNKPRNVRVRIGKHKFKFKKLDKLNTDVTEGAIVWAYKHKTLKTRIAKKLRHKRAVVRYKLKGHHRFYHDAQRHVYDYSTCN